MSKLNPQYIFFERIIYLVFIRYETSESGCLCGNIWKLGIWINNSILVLVNLMFNIYWNLKIYS